MIYTVEHGISRNPFERAMAKLTDIKFVLPAGVSGITLFWIGLVIAIVMTHPAASPIQPLPIVHAKPSSSNSITGITDGPDVPMSVSVATPDARPMNVSIAPATAISIN